jgi:sulfopropanediol 3-dehydrogenase
MTVLVAKVAGVETVIAGTPPREGRLHAPTLYSIATSGADRIFALGGVQALAAMAFGLLDAEDPRPVDMIVGPGNAFVAEAKRQLFGRVGIDLLAGPSEVAVIADDSADPELVAADLLAQAEHGPTSPAVLITTSDALGRAVIDEVGRQLDDLDRAGNGAGETPRRAWTSHGVVMVASDREGAAALSDEVAAEHLEVQTREDDWYFQRLRNYGSLFIGSRATVAFSDKAIGTNHTLPTGHAARYTGGLSVAKFLKTLTYQRIDSDEGVRTVAPHVLEISRADLMPAHEATAAKRLERLAPSRSSDAVRISNRISLTVSPTAASTFAPAVQVDEDWIDIIEVANDEAVKAVVLERVITVVAWRRPKGAATVTALDSGNLAASLKQVALALHPDEGED